MVAAVRSRNIAISLIQSVLSSDTGDVGVGGRGGVSAPTARPIRRSAPGRRRFINSCVELLSAGGGQYALVEAANTNPMQTIEHREPAAPVGCRSAWTGRRDSSTMS